jgi:SET domain-containing protein
MPRASTNQLSRAAQQCISESSPYKLRVFRSGIHRLGVRTWQNIPANRKVIEYAGERINRREARRRFLHGSPGRGKKLNYLAQLDSYWTIDGGADGNGAELINHGADPNLRLGKFGGRLWLFSIRRIRAGEELRYDYGFSKNGEIVRCRCGSPKCRGTINQI